MQGFKLFLRCALKFLAGIVGALALGILLFVGHMKLQRGDGTPGDGFLLLLLWMILLPIGCSASFCWAASSWDAGREKIGQSTAVASPAHEG